MKHMLPILSAAVTALTAYGCARIDGGNAASESAGAPAGSRPIAAAFQCGPSRADTVFEADRLRLAIDGREFELAQVISASGARYQGRSSEGPVVFWNKGREATLTIGDRTYPRCIQVGAGDRAPAKAAAYRATGNEPGWALEIGADRLDLVMDYGQRTVTAPLPPVLTTPNGRRYVTNAGAHALTVDIVHRICRDTMSGMSFPDRVTVKTDGRTLEGCGGEPASLLQGAEWIAEDIGGAGIIDRSRVTLKFDENGRVSGRAGCNRYTAPYELTGEGIRIGPAAVTRMACAQALMRQESTFFRLLEGVRRFETTPDGALVLLTAGNQRILFRR